MHARFFSVVKSLKLMPLGEAGLIFLDRMAALATAVTFFCRNYNFFDDVGLKG